LPAKDFDRATYPCLQGARCFVARVGGKRHVARAQRRIVLSLLEQRAGAAHVLV
jgi:hypothetical protein